MDIFTQALTDPENQPSQWGTVPLDDPNWIVLQWRPIAELDRTKDDTYLVRLEDGTGRGFVNKGYYADDSRVWLDDRNEKVEYGPWRITAFAPWPEYRAL